MKKIILRWVKVSVLIYSLAGILLYYLQESILFHPVPMDKHAKYNFLNQYTADITIPYDKETEINIIQFKPAVDCINLPGQNTSRYRSLFMEKAWVQASRRN